MVISDWIDILYQGAEEGWITLNFFPNKDTTWFKLGDAPPSFDIHQNCYMGIGLRKEKKKGRGEFKDIIAIPGFWLDLDFVSEAGAHKASRLPPNLDACTSLLDSAPYEPTLVVHSGHGLQAYWLFNEPWHFDGEEERKLAERLGESWQSWFKTEAGKNGWTVDSTADLPRVFRIPGTYNCKTDSHVLVSIIQQTDKRYEPSDFEDFLVSEQPTQPPMPQSYDASDKAQINILRDKNVSDRIKYLIIHGDTLSKYASRSEAVFAVISSLTKAAYDDAQIADILLNPDYEISELPLEKGVKWVSQELTRARKKSKSVHNENGHMDTSLVDVAGRSKDIPLHLNDKGYAKETFYNMSMILQHDSEWSQKLRFDSFLNTSMLDGHPVGEITEMRIAEWMGREYGFGGNNPKVLTRAIHAASSMDTYDSLQEWILALPEWDGTPRLRSWMIECCGAPETELNGWIGEVAIMQMVSRALNPGCIARLVPILEGPENKGKTRCIKLLGHPWSMTFDMSMDSKEAHMAVQGCWVAELAELDTLRKTTETRLKSFVSQQNDDYVPKYSNYRISHPRRCVFFGTTNETNYLPGQTGNTRWLPIKTEWFDLDRLEREREQLFAESLSIFKAMPDIKWWEEPESVSDKLAQERDDRRMLNVYEEDLLNWLDGIDPKNPNAGLKFRKHVTWSDIAGEYFKFESKEKWSSWVIQRQVGEALTALGWKRGQRPRAENRQKCWNRPGAENIDEDENVPF